MKDKLYKHKQKKKRYTLKRSLIIGATVLLCVSGTIIPFGVALTNISGHSAPESINQGETRGAENLLISEKIDSLL